MRYYPILCCSVFKEKIWGGHLLETVLNKNIPDKEKIYGESWEVSAHANGLGTILNGVFKGKTLLEVLENHGINILGERIWKKYKGTFPLLIKFLDIQNKLSIQVHPHDAYARANEHSFGKAECWYVMHASLDAKIIMGMEENASIEIFEKQTYSDNFEGLFKERAIKTDDLVVIKPGMVHASLKGSALICEIQQNSDITYRIYDFNRLENGVKRTLHLQKAKDVIDFSAKSDIRDFSNQTTEIVTLLDWEYFTLNKLIITETISRPVMDIMKMYAVLSGSITIYNEDSTIFLQKGDVTLIPAHLAITISGNADLLEVYPK